jgi:hypothetical protein
LSGVYVLVVRRVEHTLLTLLLRKILSESGHFFFDIVHAKFLAVEFLLLSFTKRSELAGLSLSKSSK